MERELKRMFEMKETEMKVPPTLSPELRKRIGRQRMVVAGLVAAAACALAIGGFAAARSLSNDAAPIPPAEGTEKRDPRALTYNFPDVEVTLHAAEPWAEYSPAPDESPVAFNDAWAGGTALVFDQDSEETLGLDAHPGAVGTACQSGVAADAETLARQIRSDTDLEATAPVRVSVAGVEALRMDVRAASGAEPCSKWGPAYPSAPMVLGLGSGSGGAALGEGSRMRLYLLDTPWRSDQWSRRVFAVWIVAPETRFEQVLEAAQPILESMEFHAK